MDEEDASIPDDLPEADVILSTRRMVPRGAVHGIRFVLFVPPEDYFSLESPTERTKLEREIGALNAALKGETFICVGPGRWGTSTPNLGVHVAYGDIYNTRALVELSGSEVGTDPEPSFGTHFFQDLMEAHIFPLAVNLDDKDAVFNRKFFFETPNRLDEWRHAPNGEACRALKLIKVEDFRPGSFINLIMDDDEGRAAAFLSDR
jgi:hypothetical protein